MQSAIYTLFIVSNLICLPVLGQQVLINEVVSNNISGLSDEDGDLSDWIELYNPGKEALNLEGYWLTDDSTQNLMWQLPNVELSPGEHLLIFASGKDRTEGQLHTNFSIDEEGEVILLSDELGNVINHCPAVLLGNDQSLGRLPDGSSNWQKLNPTPASSNQESNDQLSFSHESGFYSAPFELEISSLMSDSIRCTFNGEKPTSASEVYSDDVLVDFQNGEDFYFSSIPTTPETNETDYELWQPPSGAVDMSTIVRCASFREGAQVSQVYSKTYFVDSVGQEKYKAPVISLITDGENLFSEESGIYVPGVNLEEDNPDWTGNYYQKGEEWERPVHIEFFDEGGQLVFGQDAGIRIHGGASRHNPQKSLRLYARNEYGLKYFQHKLLPARNVERYKRFILRGSMNSYWDQLIFKDVLAHQMVKNLDLEYQEYRPVIVFINGEYWGIHGIRDRIDTRYLGYLHDSDPDDFLITEGYNDELSFLRTYMEENDMSLQQNYDFISSQLDINNFIDYWIAKMFVQDFDWPQYNLKMWKSLHPNGKWRWLFYDADAGMTLFDMNMVEYATNTDSTERPHPSSTSVFRSLLQNEDFKARFLDRYSELLNSEFVYTRARQLIDEIEAKYAPLVEDHSNRWNHPESFDHWGYSIDRVHRFYKNRPCIVEENLRDFFSPEVFRFYCTPRSLVDEADDFVIYPNPVAKQVSIMNGSETDFAGDLMIRSISGQQVFKLENIEIKKSGQLSIELSMIDTGVYLLSLTNQNQNIIKKLIVQND